MKNQSFAKLESNFKITFAKLESFLQNWNQFAKLESQFLQNWNQFCKNGIKIVIIAKLESFFDSNFAKLFHFCKNDSNFAKKVIPILQKHFRTKPQGLVQNILSSTPHPKTRHPPSRHRAAPNRSSRRHTPKCLSNQ